MSTYYKVTNEDGETTFGAGAWPLPQGDQPGEWRVHYSNKRSRKSGLRLCRRQDLVHWLGSVIWEAEADENSPIIEGRHKVVVGRARLVRRMTNWTEQTARLFAADCAERVLHIADDERCNAAVLAGRRYAFGLISDEELAAARDAIWSAIRNADCNATRDAAIGAARAAVEVFAKAGAWSAASSAAGIAAEMAERQWQTDRLFQYLDGDVDLGAIRASVEVAA